MGSALPGVCHMDTWVAPFGLTSSGHLDFRKSSWDLKAGQAGFDLSPGRGSETASAECVRGIDPLGGTGRGSHAP